MKPFEEYLAGEAQLADDRMRAHYQRRLEKQRRKSDGNENFCLFLCMAAMIMNAIVLGMSL